MISLLIQNLILIEKAHIFFGPGLNILTGETGAGKSAILSAIRLISGDRADTQMIRKGADFAIVEAVLPGPIHVRREIYRSGKNRCFIDDAQVNVSALRKASQIERVDQSSSLDLCSIEKQGEMLDIYAGLTEEAALLAASLQEEKGQSALLEKLEQNRHQHERELEWAKKDLDLIEEVNWQPGEDEKLAQEHHFLSHAQELLQKLQLASFSLTEGQELPSLKRSLSALESCIRFDPQISPIAQTVKSALLELEEAGRTLLALADKIESDPNRLAHVEERISAVESLKRRFGSDIEGHKKKLQDQLDMDLDSQIENLRISLNALRKENQKKAESLDQKRRAAAVPFTSHILNELQSLNIPHAQFEVTKENRFLFSANRGHPPIPLEQCASGGELSRLLLAIKTALAGEHSTLVFDEIDSNVGGQTAAILGEKLKRLAEKRQLICVTHFVQVAKCATDHFLVQKTEENGKVFTLIKKICAKEKEIEYGRMLGTIR